MTIPARLCVVRHGETDWNLAGILQGWFDVPLNDRAGNRRETWRQPMPSRASTGSIPAR